VRKRNLAALLLAVPLLAYVVYPLGSMLAESVTLGVSPYRAQQMGWDPQHQPFAAGLRRVFAEKVQLDAIWGTLSISIATVLCAGAWGLAQVLLWHRRDFPGRKIFGVFGYVPLILPPLVGTLAFFRLIGEGGWLWHALPISGGRAWLNGFGQVLLMHTYAFGMFTYAYVSAALEDADSSREEAARSLGAGRLKTFFAAVWPVISPALLASALLTFMAAAASFSAPYFLDNSSRYLTVEILNQGEDIGMQRSLSLVLALLSLSVLPAFLYFDQRERRGAEAAFGLKGTSRQNLHIDSTSGKVIRILFSLIAGTILIAPPVVVLLGSIAKPDGGIDWPHFADLATDMESLGRSSVYGVIAAILNIAAATAIALALRRAALWASLPVEIAVMLALALPGSVIAVALLSAFNGPSPLTAGVPLGQTAAILILAYFIRDLPLAVRPARAALYALGSDMENASAGLGATRAMTLWRVTLPVMFPSLLAAGLICFITGTGEYVASKLLAGVLTKPVSVRIDELFRVDSRSPYPLALALMGLSIAAIVFAKLASRRDAIRG